MKSTTSISAILVILVTIPSVLNKALPQEDNEINPDPTTIDADSDGDRFSSSTETFPTKKPIEFPRIVIDDVQNDYDMFLEHVNRTSQHKLELFDKTLEQELQPGRPLMKVVELFLGIFQQVQANNNNRRKQNNTKAKRSN